MINDVLIIYEEELYADGLLHIINEINPEIRVTKCILYNDLEQSISSTPFDLIIISKTSVMDISYVCPLVKKYNPNGRIVMLSRSFSSDDVKKYMEYGIDGLICKKYSSAKIKNIMSLILMGENYYPPELLPLATKTVLSAQQLKIVDYLRYGYSNKQIAYELGITESTVKAHMTMIMRKLNVVNRIQAIRKAVELGLLDYTSAT